MSGPLCTLRWRILTWFSRKQVILKARHIPGQLNVLADKLSRLGQTIQAEWSVLPVNMLPLAPVQVDPFATRFNNKLPHLITSARPSGMGSGCTQPALGGSGPLCLPIGSHLGQSGGEVAGPPMQESHFDCSRMAQHGFGT